MWHWWLERNRIRGGERRREVAGLAFIIRFQAEEYMKFAARENPKPSKTLTRWTKPAEVLKINSDGVFNPATRRGGWGFVICDSEGVVILAGAGAVPHALDALHIQKCWAALSWSKQQAIGECTR